MRDQARFQKLVGRLLDDRLSSAERDELAALCRDHPERLQALRSALELDQLIAQNVVVNRCEDAFAEDVGLELAGAPLADYEELVSRFLDSSLRQHEYRRLHAMCQRDPERGRRLREELEFTDLIGQVVCEHRNEENFVDALVTRMWAETATDHFVDDVASKIAAIGGFQRGAVGADPIDDSKVIPLPRIQVVRSGHSWRRTVAFAAAAAVAAALAVLALLNGPFGGGDRRGADLAEDGEASLVDRVAVVTESSDDVRWSAASMAAIGEQGEVGLGRYHLESGVVRVRFASGAEMTVEGPAEFELRSDREAYVHSGLAMARAENPGDLQVQSKGIELVDVDRTFAVDARFDTFTEAVFFDGAGQLRTQAGPGGGTARTLHPFETVRADHQRDRLVDVPYNPSVFTRTWQLISGVEASSGSVEIELPGAIVIPRENTPDKVQVFVERDGFFAEGGVEVDLLTPGKFTSLAAAESGDEGGGDGIAIQPEGELRSYLLQRWAPGRGGASLEASVTFSEPVVGVIFSSDRLARSDKLVGADLRGLGEAFDGSQPRGLDQLEGEDQILLSADGRTLNVVLHGGDRDALDHIRVLVQRQ